MCVARLADVITFHGLSSNREALKMTLNDWLSTPPSVQTVIRNPSPGAVDPGSRLRRRYADPPAAALLTGLAAGEWSPLRSRPYAVASRVPGPAAVPPPNFLRLTAGIPAYPASGCVAGLWDVVTFRGLTLESRGLEMKLTDWLSILSTVQNGWTFAALVAVLLYLHFSRRGDPPKDHP
jgi:hypothetical protein